MKWLSQNLAQLTDALTAWFVRKDQSIVLKAEKFLRFNGGTSFPTGVSEGAVYYRTDTNTLYVYDGSS